MSHLLFLLLACSSGPTGDGPVIQSATVRSIDAVTLQHTPVTVDRELMLVGDGFMGTSVGPWVHFGDVESPSVRLMDANTVIALVPEGVHGTVAVRLTNPDQQVAELSVDLH